MSDSVRPHRRPPTRLLCPWDSPGKNTGVGCHFLLQCMKVKMKVKLFSHVQLLAIPWTAAYQAPPSMGFSRQEYWSGLPLRSFPVSVFSNESVLRIRWPKYWSFRFISPSNEYSGLISFRMDWLDLLAVQGTLKSLLQHHSSKASVLWHSDFFIIQLSHPYMTTGKTIALTRWTFVG